MAKKIQKTEVAQEPVAQEQVAPEVVEILDNEPQNTPDSPDKAPLRPILYLFTQGCTPELASLSLRLWRKFTGGRWSVQLVECSCYEAGVITCLGLEDISDIITCVDATTLPVSNLCDGDLMVIKSFAFNAARRAEFGDNFNAAVKHYIPTGLPISYDKDDLSDLIASPKLNLPEWSSVNIPTIYQVGMNVVPFNASVADTNITGLVARKNPNMEIVKSYFADRKFVMVTQDGFDAIKHLFHELAAK